MNKKILIVDDELEIIDMVKVMLESEGYRTITAYSGEGALKLLNSMKQNELPDLILLDIMMVPMDGWQTLEKIKSNENLKKIPVSMLTVVPLLAETMENKDIDKIENYITKPFTTEKLLEKVGDIIGTKKKLENMLREIEKKLGKEPALEYKKLNERLLRHRRLLQVLEESAIKEKKPDKSTKIVLNNEKRLIRMWRVKMDKIEKKVM